MKRNETAQQTMHFDGKAKGSPAPLVVIAIAVFIVAVAFLSCAASVVWQWVLVSP